MTTTMNIYKMRQGFQALMLATTLAFVVGCKQQAAAPEARTDQQVASDIQAKISAESALNGQNIQVSVANGVATLSGAATDDASRALAGNDAGSVSGVKTVINNLSVQPPQQAQAAPPPPPPAPAPPAVKTVTVPAGTIVPVRITDALTSQNAQPNQVFHGTLASDLIVDGMVAAMQGSTVTGRVVDARDAGHFKGNSLLAIELTGLSTHTRQIPLVTDTYSKEGAGRGKNTAMKSGGGAVAGAIIGALAGGGKGAAIGAVAGGGAGAGVNAITRGQQVTIQPETLINFRLQSPITVTTARSAGSVRSFDDNSPSPQLQQRPQ